MRAELIQNRVGRPVKDAYGRYVGSVVGFSVDTSGELSSIGLDQCGGEFHEYASNRIISDKEGFVIIPRWRVDAEGLARETETVVRRAQALADLKKEGEIPAQLYDEMRGQYDEQLKSLQESYSNLAQEVRGRADELDRQAQAFDRFLVNLKVQFRSGEIDEGTFKAEAEYCSAIRHRDMREREDLTKLLRTIIEPAAAGSAPTIPPMTKDNKSTIQSVPEVTIS
jgi:CdvA-like coiled-coil domain